MSYLQIVLDNWTSVGFLGVATDRIILSKTGSFAGVRSVSTLPEINLILKFPIISLPSVHVRVVERPVRIVVVCANLVRAVPLIARCSHPFDILISAVLLSITHAYAIYML